MNRRENAERIKKMYPPRTRLCLEHMEGEPRMRPGLKGVVDYVDDAGQIHMRWENGSTLALVPEKDRFHKADVPNRDKNGVVR